MDDHPVKNYNVIARFAIDENVSLIQTNMIPPRISLNKNLPLTLVPTPDPTIRSNETDPINFSANRIHNKKRIFDSYLTELIRVNGEMVKVNGEMVKFKLYDFLFGDNSVDFFIDRKSLRELMIRCIDLNYLLEKNQLDKFYCKRKDGKLISETFFNTMFIASQTNQIPDSLGFGKSFETIMTSNQNVCESIEIGTFSFHGLKIAVAFRTNGIDENDDTVKLATKKEHPYHGLDLSCGFFLDKFIEMRFGNVKKLFLGCLKKDQCYEIKEFSFDEVEHHTDLTKEVIEQYDQKLVQLLNEIKENVRENSTTYTFNRPVYHSIEFRANSDQLVFQKSEDRSILMSDEVRLDLYQIIIPYITETLSQIEGLETILTIEEYFRREIIIKSFVPILKQLRNEVLTRH